MLRKQQNGSKANNHQVEAALQESKASNPWRREQSSQKLQPYPLFVSSAKGSRFRSADGEDYLDYCMGYGALLNGHTPTDLAKAVKTAVDKGTIYGQPTEMEVELAELITSLMP